MADIPPDSTESLIRDAESLRTKGSGKSAPSSGEGPSTRQLMTDAEKLLERGRPAEKKGGMMPLVVLVVLVVAGAVAFFLLR